MNVDMNEFRVAVIGMAVNLPGAEDKNIFWKNLCTGVESAGEFPIPRQIELEKFALSKKTQKIIYKNGAYLNDISSFDYSFFKITKKEAIEMHPAQRLFLQNAIAALDDAGYGGMSWYGKNIGVYVGYIGSMEVVPYQNIVENSTTDISAPGILSSNIAGRLSYFMNFIGESVLLDSACSSSFAALKCAYNALRNNEAEAAIVGGVQLNIFPEKDAYKLGIGSKDGRTKPFDESADGAGEGEGVVNIILKPLERAVKDKDHIYGVIDSIVTNQDGRSLGLTAPNPRAQVELIKKSLLHKAVNKNDISYMEFHGTGTNLGDPIEINAAIGALQQLGYSMEDKIRIGSVKANIGHNFAASGLTGLIKCCMMMEHKKISPQINYKELNHTVKEKDFFVIEQKLVDWESSGPRKCAISNFGLSGTNYHCIVSEYGDKKQRKIQAKQIFLLSSEKRNLLKKQIKNYIYYGLSYKEAVLQDICYTLAVGRGHYLYRMAIICEDMQDLVDKLSDFNFCSDYEKGIFYGYSKPITDIRKEPTFGEKTTKEVNQLSTQLNQLMNQEEVSDNEILMQRFSSGYVNGANINWNQYYKDSDVNRVSLPAYIFDTDKCWPE